MQNVIPRKCDLCNERSTSLERNDEGDVRLCDKHYIEKHGNNGFDCDLQRRREWLQTRIASIIIEEISNEMDFQTSNPMYAAKRIMEMLKL